MSTRSNTARGFKARLTDPRWYPTTQGLNRWINKIADRSDLTVRVLKNTNGAPARFVPAEAEIDINEALIASIDPVIAGSPEFVVKHRACAGACVHEACHARVSARIDLPKIARQHGARHAGVFSVLEEGRCETQTWPHLNGVERLALQSMVLEIVLRDMQNDEGETPPLDMAGVIRLAGLLMARIETGIVDISHPLSKRMNDALIIALGADYAVLYDLAVRFSQQTVSWYDSGDSVMHAIVRQWIEVEDRLVPPSEDKGEEPGPKGEDEDEDGEPGGEGGDEGEDGEEGDGEGQGGKPSDKPGKGKGKPKDKPKPEEGEGESEGSGEGDGKEQGEDQPGDDDNGTIGDGTNTLTGEEEGDASLGQYASSNVDAGSFEDIFSAVREAADEAESISGSRLREEVVAIHRANASAHAERRRKNAVAAKRWR